MPSVRVRTFLAYICSFASTAMGVWGGGGWAEGEILVSPFHSVQTEISALDLTPGPPILDLKPILLFFFFF